MTIHGPGKRPSSSQPPLDEAPQKRPRTQRGGHSVREQPVAASVPTNEPLSGTASQPLESPVATRLVEPLTVGGQLLCFDESLINTSLQMLYQFYDHQLRDELLRSAQSRHPGQQVAITLANFFEYQIDCKDGTREASAEITSQYQKAILQACIAYCAKDTTFVATLEKEPLREEDFQLQEAIEQELQSFESDFDLDPLGVGMTTPLGVGMTTEVSELPGGAEIQEAERQQMQAFLSGSGMFPHSGTLFIQNLIHIVGLPNLGAGSIETSTMDYVLVDNNEVITREEVTTDAFPVLEINSDGKDIPDCFARTCQYFRCREVDPQVDTSAGYVKGSGEPYSGEIPARATTTREYILKPVRPGSRFFIQFYSGGFTQEDTGRIIESTASPFTCSSLLNKAHMDASIDGILCFCGNFVDFHHKYLRKVKDGWLVFDETEPQQRKVQNLSDAFSETDKPITLVCKLLSPARSLSDTLPPPVSHDSTYGEEPYTSCSPTEFLVPIPSEPAPAQGISGASALSPAQTPTPDSNDRNLPPDDGQQPGSESVPYSGDNESTAASADSHLMPALSSELQSQLEKWQSQKKTLKEIYYVRGFNEEGKARPEYPIPPLPGLKPEIESWAADLMSYVIHLYQFDQEDEQGRAIHNPTWELLSLRVLQPDSQQYLEVLEAFFNKEWQSYQSVPSLYYRLVQNKIPIPSLEGIPPELRGTTQWNEQIIAGLLMDFCHLSESPLEPHPLVHEIIRLINNDMGLDDLVKLQNQRMTIADSTSAPGILPLQNDNFRKIQQKWNEQLIRYLVDSNLEFIKNRCTVPIPKACMMTDFDRLRLFKADHQEVHEALKRLTEGAINNKSERLTFLKIMPLHVDLRPDQIPWCPMTDKEWGMAPLNHLARHFGFIATDSEVPEYKSLIASLLKEAKVPSADDVAKRLNRQAKKNSGFSPPVLEGLARQPKQWGTALVKAVVNQEFKGSVPESYKIMPEDILQIYSPDSPEYLKGLKQYLQIYINTDKYVSFQGMLDYLNWKVTMREFLVLTPFLDELPNNQKGVTPWNRNTLQTVINALGLENPPQSRGSGMEEIAQAYLSGRAPTARGLYQRLNKKTAGHKMTPVPDELKPLLIEPKISGWTFSLIRLSIALFVSKTTELQSGLPRELRVKKEDINQLVKSDCRHLLTPYLQSLL